MKINGMESEKVHISFHIVQSVNARDAINVLVRSGLKATGFFLLGVILVMIRIKREKYEWKTTK